MHRSSISVKYDDDDNNRPGWKFHEYEFKGIPVRLAIGPRDIQNNTVEVARRDTLSKESMPIDGIADNVAKLLDDIQNNLFKLALERREQMTHEANTWEEFCDLIEKGGFVLAHWDGTTETEIAIKEKTKATIRVLPFEYTPEEGKCILTGKPSHRRVIFARAY